ADKRTCCERHSQMPLEIRWLLKNRGPYRHCMPLVSCRHGIRLGNRRFGVIISSQSGHRLGALSEEQNRELATTPTEELLELPFLKEITDTLKAYQYSKRCNVLRVMYEATNWGKRGATINSISPGIIITPLANDELKGPRGEGYRKMLSASPAGRAGTPDEVGELAEFLMSKRGRFISGSDYLIDGGTTASYMVMHKYYEIVVLYNQQVPPSRNQLRELEQEWGHIR
ncbi:MAG: SDR family oxidoreductase, partial [Selenomonadaceae bacterium]|nr:SDR family oxidoreductase [Selenomonadaceae bacterium]